MRHRLVKRAFARAAEAARRDGSPAVALKRRVAVFVEPVLVAEVEYRTWTDEGKLRHASFQGIRERADDAVVFTLA
nr:hypothetical protein [Sinorhizobium arboris]